MTDPYKYPISLKGPASEKMLKMPFNANFPDHESHHWEMVCIFSMNLYIVQKKCKILCSS